MKALLIWSDGLEINTHLFVDEKGKTGTERAREQMHLEYECMDADESLGAYEGYNECLFMADGRDACVWQIVEMPEEATGITDGVTQCCGYDFGLNNSNVKYCPVCGKKLIANFEEAVSLPSDL